MTDNAVTLFYFIPHAIQWYGFIREGKEKHYLICQWSVYTCNKAEDWVLSHKFGCSYTNQQSLEELTSESWDWKQRLALINICTQEIGPILLPESHLFDWAAITVTLNSFALDFAQPTAVQLQKARRMSVGLHFWVCAHVWVHMYITRTMARKRSVSVKMLR